MTTRKMTELGLSSGDYVRLEGNYNRQTASMVRPDNTLTSDDAVRLTMYTKITLRVKNADLVRVRVFPDIKYADSVEMVPFEDTLVGVAGMNIYEDFIRPFFSGKFRALTKNDVFCVRVKSATVEFKVLSVDPSPTAVVIGRSKIAYQGQPLPGKVEDASINQIGFMDIGGCDKAILVLRNLVELPLRYSEVYDMTGIEPPHGILICGPHGTGKSILARAISNETDAALVIVECKQFGNDVGKTEGIIRNAFITAEKNNPAIVLFENIDAISQNSDQAQGASAAHLVGITLKYVDGAKWKPGVIMLATTSRPNDVDPAIIKSGRFDNRVDIGMPDLNDRLAILKILTRRMRLSSDVNLEMVASEMTGFVGSELQSLCHKAGQLQIEEKAVGVDMKNEALRRDVIASIAITTANFQRAAKSIKPSFSIGFEYPKVTWKDVDSSDEVRSQLREIFGEPFTYSDQYLKFGMSHPNGVLIFGPPGCAKSLLARATAGEFRAPLLFVKGPAMLSSKFGQSEENIKKLFHQAQDGAPCFLVFDEFDSMGRARGTNQDSEAAMSRVIAELLTSIDSIRSSTGVIIICITNLPDVLDPALLRPSRLENFVYIALPDEKCRLGIFKRCLEKMPVAKDVDMDSLAKNTKGYSGADVNNVCGKAQQAALHDYIKRKKEQEDKILTDEEEKADPVPFVTMAHFHVALTLTRPSVDDAELIRYTKFLAKYSEASSSKKSGDQDASNGSG